MCWVPLRSLRLLAQDRLGFGDHMAAIVEDLDILHGNRTRGVGLVGVVERDREVADANLLVDRDGFLDRDRVADAGPEYPNLAERRALAGTRKIERYEWLTVFLLKMNVGDPGGGLEVAEAD